MQLNNPRRETVTTEKGRTNPTGFGPHVGLDKATKSSKMPKNSIFTKQNFKEMYECLSNSNVLKTGLRFFSGITYKDVANGIHSIANTGKETTPLIGNKISNNLGDNKAKYDKYHYHIGVPTSSNIKAMAKSNNVDFVEKSLADSTKDYQDHQKRKNLKMVSGFDRKKITFLMEDTFMSVKDYLTIYNKPYKTPIEELIQKNSSTKLYGCSYYTKTQFKFSNTIPYYDSKIVLHLVKITDLDTDVRSLIEDITNNNGADLLNINEKNNQNNQKNNEKTEKVTKKSLRNPVGKAKDLLNNKKLLNNIKRTMNLGSYFEDLKDNNIFEPNLEMRERLRKLERIIQKTSDGNNGKIAEDEQYTDPKYTDKQNKITISFETSLKTKLTDSLTFNQKAKIVQSWYKTLTPGSIWEFNLEQHLGNGILLNHLVDLSYRNKEHPAGYIFVIEQFGDRRGKVRRLEDGDLFLGYSPSSINFEFYHKLGYLTEHSFDSIDNSQGLVYRKKKREEDFDETESLFQKEFCPDRESKFNLDFNDIHMGGAKKNYKYSLEYDSNIFDNTNPLDETIKNVFESFGFDRENVTENDFNLLKNMANSDINDNSKSFEEYEGTGGVPPQDN